MSNIYALTDSWTGGGAFTAIQMNVTDTSSTAGSLLMDLQVGGTSKFNVKKNGYVNGPTHAAVFGGNALITTAYAYITGILAVGDPASGAGTVNVLFDTAANNVAVLNSAMKMGWGSQAPDGGNASALRTSLDTQFTRVSTGVAKISNAAGTFGGISTQPGTVANLPAAAAGNQGTRAFVTDASTTIIAGIGTTVVGGGANKVPVYSDGTNWLIG